MPALPPPRFPRSRPLLARLAVTVARAATLLVLLLAAPATALELRRGLNLDIWVEWLPVEAMLARDGFLDVFPDWRRHVSEERLPELRAAGFDFVRLPVEPGPLLALGPGARRQSLLDQVVETIEDLHAAGLAVVVDLHLVSRPGAPYGAEAVLGEAHHFAAYLELVEAVGRALDGFDPSRTAFEPMNEPNHDCAAVAEGDAVLWPPMLERLHATARSAAPHLPLVLTGACWGHAQGLASLDPTLIEDENVVWSFHSYEPFIFTHQSAEWLTIAERYLTDVPYPPSRLDDALIDRLSREAAKRSGGAYDRHAFRYMLDAYRRTAATVAREPIDLAAAWADRHGIPRDRLLMGEFGAMPGDRLAFLQDKRRAAEEHGIAWAVWSWGDAMAITSGGAERRLDPAVCGALGLQGCERNEDKYRGG